MDSEDGQLFIRNLAYYVRTHEKALANALQLQRQQNPKHVSAQGAVVLAGSTTTAIPNHTLPTSSSSSSSSTVSTLAAALSLPYLHFTSHSLKPAKLTLTPHHLFYLLSRFEELGIPVGPTNIRLENLHADTSSNYVSFLGQSRGPKRRGSDHGSVRSVSSIRSVMTSVSSLWSNLGLGGPTNSAAKVEKQMAAMNADLKYLYSSFTKVPCLRLAPDRRARLIPGYEEFPFDTAVPLLAFKNVSALEIVDIDIRQFFGWDRLAEQLRSLTVKRAGVDDPADILMDIVLDDMEKRRRRSSKPQMSPISAWVPSSSPKRSPTMPPAELVKSNSAPGSPNSNANMEEQRETRGSSIVRSESADLSTLSKARPRSSSPVRPTSARTGSAHGHIRGSHKVRRSGSGSSQSSLADGWYAHRGSHSNLLAHNVLPASKWRFLRHLGLGDNSLTSIAAGSLAPLANTLTSLDLSANLFSQIPDSISSLTALKALNLSHCMIDSLHSLTRNPMPAMTTLNLRGNRLVSLAGIERLYPLEKLDLRDNRLTDPTELARLTGMPEITQIWVLGNPFTRTHGNYRVTIFNLFRSTPGHADVTLDFTGPGYGERRQLVDQVPERANVPVVKPPPPDYGFPAVNVNKTALIIHDAPKESAVLRKERPASPLKTNEGYSARRRRTPKRRIVDLSTSETSPTKPKTSLVLSTNTDVKISAEHANATNAGSDSGYGVSPELSSMVPETEGTLTDPRTEPQDPISQPQTPRRNTALNVADIPQLPPMEAIYQRGSPIKISSPDAPDWDMSGEMYRKKIETLRSEVGNGWLSVLSEEGWEPQRSPEGTLGPDLNGVRAQSPLVIHSGRTLG